LKSFLEHSQQESKTTTITYFYLVTVRQIHSLIYPTATDNTDLADKLTIRREAKKMKMIFEIRDLRFATPATVSRAGILFISDTKGSQWRSYVKSWIQKLEGLDKQKFDEEKRKDL